MLTITVNTNQKRNIPSITREELQSQGHASPPPPI